MFKVQFTPTHLILLIVAILGVIIYGGMKLLDIAHAYTRAHTVEQVSQISRAVEAFKEMYNALPGDMPNAGKFLQGCTGKNGKNCNPVRRTAGDGIIGRLDLAKSWKK